MRITMLSASLDFSGGFRVVALYAQKLIDRGHEVIIVGRDQNYRRPNLSLRTRVKMLLRGRPAPQTIPPQLADSAVPYKLFQTVRPDSRDLPDADIVMPTWWETVEWLEGLPASKGVPVHFMQDYEVWGGNVERVDASSRVPLPRITPAAWVKDMLRDTFGQDDVLLIPNAVDAEKFSAPRREKNDVFTVGLKYTTMESKGCDIAYEAVELARREIPDLRVVAFGSAEPIKAMPLPPGTEFHLRVPDSALAGIYSSCDAWLFPTRHEGFGLPILEAMGCRTPVIGTPAGAGAMLICNGAGWLVPIGDAQAMADAIVRMARLAPAEWAAMSEAAHRTANAHSWEDAADMFEAGLLRVLRGEPISGNVA